MYDVIKDDAVLLAYPKMFAVSVIEDPAKRAQNTMSLSKSARSDIAASLREYNGSMQHL